jgi:hypothetical protein
MSNIFGWLMTRRTVIYGLKYLENSRRIPVLKITSKEYVLAVGKTVY